MRAALLPVSRPSKIPNQPATNAVLQLPQLWSGRSYRMKIVPQTTVVSLLQDNLYNGRLNIDETDPSVPVTIFPTVPVSCPPCSMTLRIVNPVGLTVSNCSVTFAAEDPPMTRRTINVRAVRTAGSNSRVTQLQFHRVTTHVTGSGWDRYILQPIPVRLHFSDCYMTSRIVM